MKFGNDDIYKSMWEKEATIDIRSKVSSFMESENNQTQQRCTDKCLFVIIRLTTMHTQIGKKIFSRHFWVHLVRWPVSRSQDYPERGWGWKIITLYLVFTFVFVSCIPSWYTIGNHGNGMDSSHWNHSESSKFGVLLLVLTLCSRSSWRYY